MNRNVLEKITLNLVVALISLMATGAIVMIANGFFEWDLFPPFTEKLLYFIASAMFVLILAGAAINIMLNMSRMAFFAEQIAHDLEKRRK